MPISRPYALLCCCAALAGLASVAVRPVAAQSTLHLPSSPAEYRDLAREAVADEPCERCGVVVSVREEIAGPPPGRRAGAAVPQTGGALGPDVANAAERIAAVQSRRAELQHPRAAGYLVTVRYDDGSYGRVALEDKPALRRGDRVRHVRNTLERLP
jgi:hypothetical protein